METDAAGVEVFCSCFIPRTQIKKGRPGLPFTSPKANYFEASAEAAAAFLAFLDFFIFLAFGAEASAEAAGAEAMAEAEADAGAAMWEAAKEEAANRPATRAAISFFIF
jgi:hypothetical protein